MGPAPGPAPHRRGGRRPGRPRGRASGDRRLLRGAARPVGHRPPRGARARLGRAPPVRLGPRSRPRRSRPGRAPRRAAATTRSIRPVRCASPMASCRSSTRRRPRSASWATTRPRCGRPSRPTSCCTWRSRRRPPGWPCSATPGGPASASSREPNAHPVNSEEEPASTGGPYVVAALNGDVDNHADLKAEPRLCASRRRSPPTPRSSPRSCPGEAATAADLTEAFRRTVGRVRGLGRHRRGQRRRARPGAAGPAGQRAGRCTSAWPRTCTIVASEPYGLVEVTDTYLRMDGETPARPGPAVEQRPGAGRSRPPRAGELEGITPARLRRHAAAASEPTSSCGPR